MASVYLELPLRSVGSLSAPGIASEATLAAVLAELELKANLTDTQPVSGSFSITGGATEAKQDTQITRLNLLSTEAKQDTQITHLSTIAGKDFATQTTLAALLAELALKADLSETQPVNVQNASLAVTGTFWQATQPVSGPATDAELRATPLPVSGTVTATPPAQTGSFSEDASLSTSAETITAPAGAFACFVEADDTNTTNVRVKMGDTATTTSGIQFQPGRSEFYQGGSNISVCMESGTGKISVQWFSR